MGWQTTFTLSRRAKGCHLVTDEVANHIQGGLKDVKVLRLAVFLWPCFASISDGSIYTFHSCVQAGMLFLFMFSAHPVL